MPRIAKRKNRPSPVRIEIKKDDTVKVIAGRDKGKTGRVLAGRTARRARCWSRA